MLNGFKKQISSILCKVSVLLQYSNQESFTPVIVKTKIVLKMDEILQLMWKDGWRWRWCEQWWWVMWKDCYNDNDVDAWCIARGRLLRQRYKYNNNCFITIFVPTAIIIIVVIIIRSSIINSTVHPFLYPHWNSE